MPTTDIGANDARIQYTASAGQTVFAYDFIIFNNTDIVVVQEGVELTLTTDYTVSGVGVESGGDVTLTTGATLNDTITIYRKSTISRDSQYQVDGRFDAGPLERDLDRVFTILQEQSRDLGRSVSLDIDSSLSSILLPAASASKIIAWNSAANALENGPSVADFNSATSTATTAAATATTQAGIATTQASTATTQAGLAEDNKDYAEEWAIKAEDSPVSVAAGGDASTTFSALHWAAKAADSAAGVNLPALGAANTLLQVNAGATALEYGLVDTANLADDAVTTAKIADDAVTTAKIDSGAATDGQVLTADGAGGAAFETLPPNQLPIGSIYMNASDATNPGTLLGYGTWSAVGVDRVLIGNGSTYSAGSTGGSATQTLSSGNLASHFHQSPIQIYTDGVGRSWVDLNGATATSAGEGVTYGSSTNRSLPNTGSVGSGSSFSTLPPYLVVYMWKRDS